MSSEGNQTSWHGSTTSARKLNPNQLGNLNDEPAVDTGTSTLFPGAERYLSKSGIRKKRQLLERVEPVLGRVLEDGEQLLWILSAHQVPRLIEWFGLGMFFLNMHKVTLVITDRRVIEILMDLGGSKPGTRIRSYAWAGGVLPKRGFGKLTVSPSSDQKVTWRIAARGDRQLLKALLPRIEEQVTRSTVPSLEQESVVWHCPECGAAIPSKPQVCSQCNTRFRTSGMAAWLALAFPGAGLYYAKRPVLGTLDLVGELVLFGLMLVGFMASSGYEEMLGGIALGAFLFAVTKLESVHVSDMLVRRAIPVAATGQARWRKFAQGGTILTVVALGLMVASTGQLASSLTRDLEVAPGNEGWQVTRTAAEFSYQDDETQRSEWMNEFGLSAAVFAYLGMPGETLASFREEYEQNLRQQGGYSEVEWFEIPSTFEAFGVITPFSNPDGTIWYEIDYYIWDTESPAVHQLVLTAFEEEVEAAMTSLRDLLDHATWITAVEPTR